MKFSASLLALVSSAVAASVQLGQFPPANFKTVDAKAYNGTGVAAEHNLAKRDAGNVEWAGYCVYITNAGSGECVNLAADLNDKVSSFGPDPNQACYVYAGFDCDFLSGRVGPIRSPGVSDLRRSVPTGEEGGGRPFNDVISSYKCTYDFF